MLTPKTLGRKKSNREHMLRNMATSLVLFEKVTTTQAKAVVVKSIIDRWITLAKKNTLASRRSLLAEVFDKNAVKKMFEVLSQRYADRPSGFTTVVKIGHRLGDSAPMVTMELIDNKKEVELVEEPKKAKKIKKTDTEVVKNEK